MIMDTFHELETSIVYVIYTMCDGSGVAVRTTLDPLILGKFGVKNKKGFLFDLEKKRFIPFYTEAVEVTIADDLNGCDEVIKFVSRFI